jgi:hypothetical protein
LGKYPADCPDSYILNFPAKICANFGWSVRSRFAERFRGLSVSEQVEWRDMLKRTEMGDWFETRRRVEGYYCLYRELSKAAMAHSQWKALKLVPFISCRTYRTQRNQYGSPSRLLISPTSQASRTCVSWCSTSGSHLSWMNLPRFEERFQRRRLRNQCESPRVGRKISSLLKDTICYAVFLCWRDFVIRGADRVGRLQSTTLGVCRAKLALVGGW